ncbi:MAG: TetR/AcrR family transcriptional regulator [Bacteroidota bacterium]
MRPKKVHQEEMLAGLLSVFRTKGYEGASLGELAQAAGLKKASLYHRFPGGKKEMATAVLTYVNEWVVENLYQVLTDKELTPEQRIDQALDNINALYSAGKKTCILRSLSMTTSMQLFGHMISAGMKKWLSAFEQLGLAFHLSPAVAKQYAMLSLIEVQGSLVVTQGLNQNKIFADVLLRIRDRYVTK